LSIPQAISESGLAITGRQESHHTLYRYFELGLHRISASASANSKFGHFSQIRPNSAKFGFGQISGRIWRNLADANATAVRSVSYLITDKT